MIFIGRKRKEAVMYETIKRLADDALKLQNKNAMDAALQDISGMCALLTELVEGDFEDANMVASAACTVVNWHNGLPCRNQPSALIPDVGLIGVADTVEFSLGATSAPEFYTAQEAITTEMNEAIKKSTIKAKKATKK